jgi:thymidylate synthase
MYHGIPTQPSCARAWVQAASAIVAGGEAYNVVIDVEDPTKFDDHDNAVLKLVDSFLRERKHNPIATVSNTIFPQALYEAHGSPKFYDEYHKVYDHLTDSKKWGRYFERMTRHQTMKKESYNPLQDLIDKLKDQGATGQRFKSTHELAVYDPLLDRRYRRGGQCLSFLSFKLHPDKGLLLTAIYRNHHYIARCLGNLIGLGRLQAFVAKEAKVSVGSLTCVSTHAEIDTGEGWGIRDAKGLIGDAHGILNAPISGRQQSAVVTSAE